MRSSTDNADQTCQSERAQESKPTKRGTFYVAVTVRDPHDGSNADVVKFGMWPGTAAGATPPATWNEAVQYGLKNIAALSMLPGAGVCELRITTFEQGGADDYLTMRDDNE
jgi:hypothetical protein